MQSEKGKHSNYKLNAILGIKYNHENKYSHNFLVQFQNIKTNFIETVEVAPELLRYKFKIGNIYKEGKFVNKDNNQLEKYLEIDTFKMKEQIPLYKVLSKDSIKNILGESEFNAFKFGSNFCYVHENEEERYVIPSYVVALYYYFRSSSMKEALYKSNAFNLYDKMNSNLTDKSNAILVLESYASKLDGPFIYRFLTNETSQKGFIDFSRSIATFKNKMDISNKVTNIVPITALFPTREAFNIKIRYAEIKDALSNKKTYLVNEIQNDDSTLDFEKLTVLKKKRKDGEIDTDGEDKLNIKGRKPKKRKTNVVIRTPLLLYGTHTIKELENNQNLSLQNKDVIYGLLEEKGGNTSITTVEEKKGEVSVSFSKGTGSGDETAQESKLENDDENKMNMSKPAIFDIFLESIDFIENSNLVSEFFYDDAPKNIPVSYTKNNEITSICMIDNRIKEYVSCSFEYNDTNIVLLEVESDNNDFATWVMASKESVSEEDIIKILEMRYSEQKLLEEIKQKYNNLSYLKFNTHRHAQINDENEHEEVLERWLLRLLYKIST
ncbi:hypothetical protein PJV94_08740 [Aliarcobacter butzleri]|uniref:hypothetical protein n=1 Tax=Aliarcobacter butzleri TaxID=28197 RepID=UPI001ED9CC50|nr:hypothetical protein [Aliarcobacter butzleri]MCG3667654.1 hypothetical protein [Aliarcobacter butzleri]MDN5072801.1 hypothetical protein [Aliarcobacter butzleri]MDN5121757.1 hypothetical protein [Aliarcobacter butzleri]